MMTSERVDIGLTLAGDRPPGTRRILIVDDEEAILFAYRELFEEEGMEVDACKTLVEVLALLRTQDYCAVISDIRLAGSDNTDGLTILECVRGLQPAAKVIIVTGYGTREIEHSVHAMGAACYFEKPVKPLVILDTMRAIVLSADGAVH